MDLKSVSASEDVIGDLPSPGVTINSLKLVADQDEGDKWSWYTGRVGCFHVSVRVYKIGLWGK